MDADTRWWIKVWAYLVLAVIGGVLGYLMRALEKGDKPSLLRSILEGTAAGFAGLIILLLCRVSGIGEEMTGVIVGIGGWLGASATIRKLEPLVFKNLGGQDDTPPNNTPVD